MQKFAERYLLATPTTLLRIYYKQKDTRLHYLSAFGRLEGAELRSSAP